MPAAVAVPANAADVVTLVEWARDRRMPLTPRGSGSSMGGGAVGGGIVVDLSRLPLIPARVDPETSSVTVSPSATCAAVDALAREHGMRFPVDPSSAAFCTIGGMVATNAAGARTLRYGQMNAWVQGLECVFADGSRGWVRRESTLPDCEPLRRFAALESALLQAERAQPSRHAGVRKESSGYALATWARSRSVVDLLTGSEGTLALFTAVQLRLLPIPGATGTILAAFKSIDEAVEAAQIASELNAATCELLDRTFLDIARRGGPVPVPDATDAVLIIDLEESGPERLAEMSAAIEAGAQQTGALHVERAVDAASAKRLWHLRHAASPILAGLASHLASMQIIEDGAVPPGRLGEYVRGVRAILASGGFDGVIFGHAGDGHVHANVLVDVRQTDWRTRLERLFDDGVALIQSLGGTLSGEHGDGRLRAAALARTWPEASIARFRAVKDAFDPAGLFNPGVKLPAPGVPSFGGAVKYDPSLDPLPEAARTALERVQRDRAWHRFRLELLEETRG
jgi:FAD/FMN-containing dehydrogenase